MKKILIVDDLHKSFFERLDKNLFETVYEPEINREEILNCISGFQGLIIRSKTVVDKEFLDKAMQLEFIARAGAGLDAIDLKETKKREIITLNAPEGNRNAVGEHALGMLLALFNKLTFADRHVRDYKWDREGHRGLELEGRCVGIIGYGNTGKSFARKLAGFDVKVLAYDKYLSDYGDEYAEACDPERLVQEMDVLSLHIPLTSETDHMLDDSFFSSLKKPIHLINAARGEILDNSSLLRALEKGKVQGAALDVLENEKKIRGKLDEHAALLERNDVIFSPHVGGWTVESYRKISEVLADKINGLID